MDTIKMRDEISHYLDSADDRFLQLVHGMIKADQMLTVGYNPDGSAITKEDLVLRAEQSEKDIKEGRVKSLKQVQEDMKSW
jgi:hypothetical protein